MDKTNKSTQFNYTTQVPDTRSFVRFDLVEGRLIEKHNIRNWLNEMPLNFIKNFPDKTGLKDQISKWLNLSIENMTISNGTDTIIDAIPRALLTNKCNVLCVLPTFFRFQQSSLRNANIIKTVLLKEENQFKWTDKTFSILEEKLQDENVKLIWIASPNNPTGQKVPADILDKILKINKLVVLDITLEEDISIILNTIKLVKTHKNIIILTSFTKAIGLAGIRFGIAIASKEIISTIEAHLLPFDISGPTVFLASKLLEVISNNSFRSTKNNHNKFISEIKSLDNILVIENSCSNFVMLKHKNSMDLFSELKKRQILVVDLDSCPGIEGKKFIRIACKNDALNKKLISVLKEVLKGGE